jgi:hypothetical protein
MKALSIRQPWAWLIVSGYKDIENRTWPSYRRGEMLIHAAKGMTNDEYDDVVEFLSGTPELSHIKLPDRKALARGEIIGVAEIVGCATASQSPWFFGPHGFQLKNARAFTSPLSFKGALGFFDVPDELVADQLNQVAR